MSREIKFRVVNPHTNKYIHFPLYDLPTNLFTLKQWAEVDKEQFTGLLDKNGKEIYEGDILASTSNTYYEPREIVWFEHESRFGIRADEDEDPLLLNAYHAKNEYEIIGNIYENRELLK